MYEIRKKKAEGGAYVEYGIIVDGNHTTPDLFCDLNSICLIRAKDASTKTIFRSIGEFNGFFHGFVTLNQGNRREHYENTAGEYQTAFDQSGDSDVRSNWETSESVGGFPTTVG